MKQYTQKYHLDLFLKKILEFIHKDCLFILNEAGLIAKKKTQRILYIFTNFKILLFKQAVS